MKEILSYLDKLYPDAHCELLYNKDYELLFKKYNSLEKLSQAPLNDIENIIKEIGTYKKKSIFIKEISQKLINDYNGSVPNNREYLKTLPGVGNKTINVFLSEYFQVPAIAVDTHVERISKRLKIANQNDDVLEVEKKLMKKIPQNRWIKTHHQLIFFGRYHCKAKKPNCLNCKLKHLCTYYKQRNKKEEHQIQTIV